MSANYSVLLESNQSSSSFPMVIVIIMVISMITIIVIIIAVVINTVVVLPNIQSTNRVARTSYSSVLTILAFSFER